MKMWIINALMRLCVLFALLPLAPLVLILWDYLGDIFSGYGFGMGREIIFVMAMPAISIFFVILYLLLKKLREQNLVRG